jgi:hypothetical protein
LRSWFNDVPDRVGVEQVSFPGRLFKETTEVLADPLKPREAAQPLARDAAVDSL